jgi:hypothetical protein
MVGAKNVVNVPAQVFVANDELLLPVLKTFTLFNGSLHATGDARCFQSLCSSSYLH